MRKGQTGIEYLIIIALVMAVSATAVLWVTGAFGGQKSALSLSQCKEAATRCKSSHIMTPMDPCTFCEKQCIDPTTGIDIMGDEAGPGAAVEACKLGRADLITGQVTIDWCRHNESPTGVISSDVPTDADGNYICQLGEDCGPFSCADSTDPEGDTLECTWQAAGLIVTDHGQPALLPGEQNPAVVFSAPGGDREIPENFYNATWITVSSDGKVGDYSIDLVVHDACGNGDSKIVNLIFSEATGNVNVYVWDDTLDGPLVGADVTLAGRTISTDDVGLAYFADIPVGTQAVSVSAPGYSGELSKTTDVTEDESANNVRFNLYPVGDVVVTVKDASSLNPINGALVKMAGTSVLTGVGGTASFTNVHTENSPYDAVVSKAGYNDNSTSVAVTKGATTSVQIMLGLKAPDLATAGSTNNEIILWVSEAAIKVRQFSSGLIANGGAVSWSPDGSKIAEPVSTKLYIWNTQTGAVLLTIDPKTTVNVGPASWDPYGTKIAAAVANKIQIWNAATGASVLNITIPTTAPIGPVAWNPADHTKIATSVSNQVQIWDATTGGGILNITVSTTVPIGQVAWSPDGTRIAASYSNYVTIWNAVTGAVNLSITIPTSAPLGPVAWSTYCSSTPGCMMIGVAYSNQIRIWDSKTGGVIRTISTTSLDGPMAWNAFPGTRIGAISNTAVLFWDAKTGSAITPNVIPPYKVGSMAWKPGVNYYLPN
jgi:WD40 repeat protein